MEPHTRTQQTSQGNGTGGGLRECHAPNESVLLDFQKILEQNEDSIAAIVENLQLGRINDCLSHYLLLQNNLIALGDELDNYPAGETDPYDDILSLPDEIMRKDVLEDLVPHNSRVLPKPPLAPPCWSCSSKHYSSEQCRDELGHVEPSAAYSQTGIHLSCLPLPPPLPPVFPSLVTYFCFRLSPFSKIYSDIYSSLPLPDISTLPTLLRFPLSDISTLPR